MIMGVGCGAVVSASEISDGAPERETFLIQFGVRLDGGVAEFSFPTTNHEHLLFTSENNEELILNSDLCTESLDTWKR